MVKELQIHTEAQNYIKLAWVVSEQHEYQGEWFLPISGTQQANSNSECDE